MAGRDSVYAGNEVRAAIANGELPPIASQKCKDCGGLAYCYDHRDYSKPLKVDPVCRRCNWNRGPAKPMRRPQRVQAIYKAATE